MKKFVVLVLALLLCMSSVSAFAAGKLSVVQENYYTIEGYSTYGYGYAKVQNIGDKPIKVNAGLLEIFDENGDPITSTDYMHKYAEYLEPKCDAVCGGAVEGPVSFLMLELDAFAIEVVADDVIGGFVCVGRVGKFLLMLGF